VFFEDASRAEHVRFPLFQYKTLRTECFLIPVLYPTLRYFGSSTVWRRS